MDETEDIETGDASGETEPTEQEKRLLDEAVDELERNHDLGIPWEEALASIRRGRKRDG